MGNLGLFINKVHAGVYGLFPMAVMQTDHHFESFQRLFRELLNASILYKNYTHRR